MLLFILMINCIICLNSRIFAAQIFSIFNDSVCDSASSAWTSWFNTQDPMINNGNDIEELIHIRILYKELDRCSTVSNVEYSIVEISNNKSDNYQTLINRNGLFCRGTRASPCPNYKVRFCCPIKNDSSFQKCGKTFVEPILDQSVRIVNGIEARPHSFPWAVSLEYKQNHDCGGVIIDSWHILTAAHCLDYSNDLGNYFARVGAHNRSSSGERMPIAQLFLHPDYDEYRSTNDIGVIKLSKPIRFSEEVQPICLTDNIVEPALDTTAYVVGWGNTIFQMWNTSSIILRQARLRVVANCTMYFAYEPERQVCTAPNGPAGQDHGSCQGDSGGGLLYFKDNHWYVGGVVSYAIGCGQPAYPTVFTKVSAYINWIQDIINRLT